MTDDRSRMLSDIAETADALTDSYVHVQPSGSCPCCQRRDPYEGYACNSCRSRMRSWLSEIPDLYAEALHLSRDVDAAIAQALGAQSKAGPVSGSQEARIPLHEDLFDLTHLGAWRQPVGEDQIGHLSVLATLRSWAGYWSSFRAMGEVGDRAGIKSVCLWMRERVDDMCDEDEAIGQAYGAIGALRGALRALVGETEQKPQQLHGVACKRCSQAALWRRPESEYASECAVCGNVLTDEEYDVWVRESAAKARRILRSARPAA